VDKFDLENRLIDFAVNIIKLTDGISQSKAGLHLQGQLVRCGTSPALNYGEAMSGESRKDFIHKIKIVLKELRESYVALKIIDKANLYNNKTFITSLMNEANELISIFVKSVETARKSLNAEKSKINIR
jgi:four helix bundle protein